METKLDQGTLYDKNGNVIGITFGGQFIHSQQGSYEYELLQSLNNVASVSRTQPIEISEKKDYSCLVKYAKQAQPVYNFEKIGQLYKKIKK